MKIVLLKDVHGLGKKYEAVNVADGFALNNLIPKKQAEFATDAVIARYTKLKETEGEMKKLKEEEVLSNLESIASKEYSFSAKANEQGHLFAALHKDQVAEIMNIDVSFIHMDKNIKEVGEHEVDIVVRDKKAKAKIVVNAL
jgi:large subunit ribosomal protein L9